MNKNYDTNTPKQLKFTVVLNKTSIMKIIKKNITNVQSNFENKNIHDYIYIIKILNHYIRTNDHEGCRKILVSYNLSASQLELLLKIDKMSENHLDEVFVKKIRKDFLKKL